MKTKRPLPKRLSGTKRVSGILLGLLALALVVASAASAAPFAYVSNFASGNVSVIDGATNSVVATIPVGAMPSGVAVNRAGTRAYVANSGDDSISIIDLTTNPPSVLTTLPDGSMPSGVAVSADGTRVYVASMGNGAITVIDAGTNTILNSTPTGSVLSGFIAVNPVTPRVYLTDANNITGSVIVTDNTGTVLTSFNVGSANSSPLGLAVDSSGTRLYVANTDGSVSVIDTALIGTSTNPVIATVPVGPTALQGIAVSLTGRVYVANQGGSTSDCGGVPCGSVAVISGTAIIATVTVGANPYGVATDPSGTLVFVGNADDGTTSVIDAATNTVVATVPVGAAPLVFGSFVAGPQTPPSGNPPSDPPSCDAKIGDLKKKVSRLGRHHGPAWLKAALYARGAADYELKLAKKKVGDRDPRYLRALKEFKDGDVALCAERYWRAKHEYWDAFDLAHRILRHYRSHRR